MLTDNEIITALQVFCEQDNDMLLTKSVAKEILDLINRQKAELDILIRKKETLRDEIAEKQAEIERLEADCEKQYEIAEASIRVNIADGGTSCHWCIDSTKAEAYKEFAERLKEKAISPRKSIDSKYEYVISEDFIDNLLAEMESERE